MRFLIISFVISSIYGCVTPKHWQPEQHQEMMLMCRTMCKNSVVKSYEPFTGDCVCHSNKSKKILKFDD